MPITFTVNIVTDKGALVQRSVDAFNADWAERVAKRDLPKGHVVLFAAPRVEHHAFH